MNCRMRSAPLFTGVWSLPGDSARVEIEAQRDQGWLLRKAFPQAAVAQRPPSPSTRRRTAHAEEEGSDLEGLEEEEAEDAERAAEPHPSTDALAVTADQSERPRNQKLPAGGASPTTAGQQLCDASSASPAAVADNDSDFGGGFEFSIDEPGLLEADSAAPARNNLQSEPAAPESQSLADPSQEAQPQAELPPRPPSPRRSPASPVGESWQSGTSASKPRAARTRSSTPASRNKREVAMVSHEPSAEAAAPRPSIVSNAASEIVAGERERRCLMLRMAHLCQVWKLRALRAPLKPGSQSAR